MAYIRPFRGVLYNDAKVDIAKVVAPPYDIISSGMQTRLYKKSKANIVKLILGKEEKADTARNNKYSRAKIFLDEWLKRRIFIRDTKPCFYVYQQRYIYKGKKRTRMGFIGLMKIEDPKKSGILPHEYTLDKPKEDRLNLIMKARSNLSPIFSLFQDSGNQVEKILKNFIESRKPLFTVDTGGVVHRLWRMDEERALDKIKCRMRGKKIFIADGHHRYEVALAYRNKMKKSGAFTKGMNYVMMYFSNLSERGSNLTVLSTHRVVTGTGNIGENELKQKIEKYFEIKKAHSVKKSLEDIEKGPKKKHVFCMYTGKKRLYLLTSKKNFSADKLIEPAKPHYLKKLDVTILHEVIINKILGVKNPESSIKYIRNEKDAAGLVDKGNYRIAFFLRPTAVSDMKAVAEKGVMMPQKSTYFYPKLLSGLVINKF